MWGFTKLTRTELYGYKCFLLNFPNWYRKNRKCCYCEKLNLLKNDRNNSYMAVWSMQYLIHIFQYVSFLLFPNEFFFNMKILYLDKY
jgi:hypothetical protein